MKSALITAIKADWKRWLGVMAGVLIGQRWNKRPVFDWSAILSGAVGVLVVAFIYWLWAAYRQKPYPQHAD